MKKELLSIPEAAEILSCSKQLHHQKVQLLLHCKPLFPNLIYCYYYFLLKRIKFVSTSVAYF